MVDRHGAIRWILDRGETILDVRGHPLLRHGINIDISKSQVSRLCAEIDERVQTSSSDRSKAIGPICG